ncbi:MAG: alginate export family protein, partial [Pirellulales bacterium]|nr:alginate export family protein [Pirellulales bacterium]
LTVRVGRQELLYGAQRVVSPLDWANVRRAFEGVKVITQCGNWSVDGFYTHVVPVVSNVLDEADYDQPFYGCYVTYEGFENFSFETYYLGYDNENPAGAAAGSGDFSLHTLGMRIHGGIDGWLFELEGGPQFGRQSGLGLDHEAGFCTFGLGRKLGSTFPWSPTLWCYYDYASGNNVGGDFNRFNQLFPLAHKYLGFIDAVQRANIESPNILLTMKPAKRLNLLFWYWHFMANQDTDIVPAIGGTPPQSTTSKDLGDELDIIAKFQFDPRSNVLLGWSHFWRGNKILAPTDADFFYTQWELNF